VTTFWATIISDAITCIFERGFMDNLANKNENKKTNKNELTVTDATAQIFD
jgi:hypothetical protein